MAKHRARRLIPHFKPALFILSLYFLIFVHSDPGFAMEISSVNVRISNSEIFVTTALKPDPKFIDDMNEGLSKEFTFFIDLFRVWNIWPDEFILGKKIIKNLRSNQIKREYVATSIYGNIHLEKRFKDPDSMIEWSMNIADLKLANVKELEPGTYFIKVTVESRARKLPPVIGYLLFFVPEKDFTISKNSPVFTVSAKASP